jgi:hypothetical protein
VLVLRAAPSIRVLLVLQPGQTRSPGQEQQHFINHTGVDHGSAPHWQTAEVDMRSSAAILENDVWNIDSVEQKALELIRRFNDPDREHVLRGVFKDTDGLAEIRAKQRHAETEISRVFSELVVLRGAVDNRQYELG